MSKKLKELQKEFPPAIAEKKTQADNGNVTFTTVLPKSVIKQLRIKAAQEETTIRVEILKGLIEAGYEVDDSELVDKRK